jgi:hypothetical protein
MAPALVKDMKALCAEQDRYNRNKGTGGFAVEL